jgi:hypothetical protein
MRGPLTLVPTPRQDNARQRFERYVRSSAARIESRWASALGLVEYAVEDVPQVPAPWAGPVPLSQVSTQNPASIPRIVLFFRPLQARATEETPLAQLVHYEVVKRVAQLLGKTPAEVDPEWANQDD